jgi:dihydroorotase
LKTIIAGGRVIDAAQKLDGPHDVVISGKVIEKITAPGRGRGGSKEKFRLIDAKDCVVSPGLIDMHVHLREPGYEGKETIYTGSQAAVAGGFTSIVCMANTNPVNDNQAVTGYILGRAKEALCNVYPVGATTIGLADQNMADLGELKAAGVVAYSDDGCCVMNAEMQRRIFEMAGQYDMPVLVHAEDANLAADGAMHEGFTSTELALTGIPAAAEEVMVARDILLARLAGSRLHIQHVSTAGAVELIRWAKKRKIRVTCEVTPHHFTLIDEDVGDYSTTCKVSPPLRSAADRTALQKAMADGVIDAIATDHAPHGILLKQIEFDQAANGMIGLETALGLTLLLVRTKKLSLHRALEMLTVKPAEILRLNAGSLAPGRPADVCVFNPDHTFVYNEEVIRSKSKNSPFVGWELPGKVYFTLVDGRVVYTGS